MSQFQFNSKHVIFGSCITFILLAYSVASSNKYTIIHPMVWMFAAIMFLIFSIGFTYFEPLTAKKLNKLFKLIYVIPICVAIFYFGSFMLLESASDSIELVSWQAEYQVWGCGEQLDLIDPTLQNKVGTSLLYEANDNQIHVQGILSPDSDIGLQSFFKAVGGEIDRLGFSYPTNEGLREFKNGDLCFDDRRSQVRVYINGDIYINFTNYVIYPAEQSPPGDCIIIEFTPEQSATTNKICNSWKEMGWDYTNYKQLRQTSKTK